MLFFEFRGNKYVYDSNTNAILKVSNVVYDVLKILQKSNFDKNKFKENLSQLYKCYPKTQIINAINKVKEFQNKYKLFLKNEPSEIKLPYDLQNIEKYYEGQMERIILNLTDNCNMRCEYCVYNKHYPYHIDYSQNCLKWEHIKLALDYVKKLRAKKKFSIGFYGGEPLLKFDLIKKTVEYTKDWENVTYAITTNGLLLKSEILDFFVENDFVVHVSLDGPKYIHDRYRKDVNNQGTFDRIISNLNKIREKYPDYAKARIGFSVVISPPYNLFAIKDFFDNEMKGFVISGTATLVNPYNTDFYKQFSKETLEEYEKQFMDLIDEFEKSKFVTNMLFRSVLEIHLRPVSYLKVLSPNGICVPGRLRLFLGTDGNFYICEKLAYNFKIGDVYKGLDFERIKFLLKKYVEIAQNCKDCEVRGLCNLCFLSVLKNGKIDLELREKMCFSKKQAIKKFIPIYAYLWEKHKNLFERGDLNLYKYDI